MYLLPHFITSIILTVIAWPFLGFHSLWIIVGGFLIDTDHYIFSIFKKKNFNIKDSYIYYKTKQYLKEHKAWEILHIFHTIEFLILMIILSIVTKNLFLQKIKYLRYLNFFISTYLMN